MWPYGKPGAETAFDICLGRGRESPRKFLGQCEGILQTDGYAAYDDIGGPKLAHVGCLGARAAYVRRCSESESERCCGEGDGDADGYGR
jgi:transposase IS66 family protein